MRINSTHANEINVGDAIGPNASRALNMGSDDDGISATLVMSLDIVFNCCLIPILSVLGIVGNTVNMIVLCRHGFKETTNIILVSLALNDFCYSVLNPICRLKRVIVYLDLPLSVTFTTFINIYVYPVVDVFVGLSFLHVTAIAVERFVAVFFPFYVSRVFTPYRVKVMLTFLYVYTAGFIAPLFFNSTYEWFYDTGYNVTVARLINTRFYLDNYGTFNLYLGVLLNNLFSTFTLAIIIVCSVAIIVKLKIMSFSDKQKNPETSTKTKSPKNVKVVKMLLAVCLVNLVAFLPSAILDVYRRYVMIDYFSGEINAVIGNVNETLYQFNVSVNFIIYVTMSSKFASTVRHVICCHRFKNNVQSLPSRTAF